MWQDFKTREVESEEDMRLKLKQIIIFCIKMKGNNSMHSQKSLIFFF